MIEPKWEVQLRAYNLCLATLFASLCLDVAAAATRGRATFTPIATKSFKVCWAGDCRQFTDPALFPERANVCRLSEAGITFERFRGKLGDSERTLSLDFAQCPRSPSRKGYRQGLLCIYTDGRGRECTEVTELQGD